MSPYGNSGGDFWHPDLPPEGAAIAGVRPAEIERGVTLKVSGGHWLEIHINGVKHTQSTGHERRAQRHDARKWSLAAKLLALVKKSRG
jgi:hypothetical protein